MPNRILRDWTDSEAVNALSPGAEVFFVRLIQKADDFGRYIGNPRLLRPNLFPLRLDSVRETDVDRWIAECVKACLVRPYEVDGKRFLVIEKFGQRLKQETKPKFPPPAGKDPRWTPDSDDIPELPGTSGNFPPEAKAKAETKTEAKPRAETETGEPEGGSRPPDPPTRARRPRTAGTPSPTEDEWVAYAAATWPEWPEHDVRAAWAHYAASGWRRGREPIADWRAAAKTCYHRQAERGRVETSRALVGAHPPAKAPEPDEAEAPALPRPPATPDGPENVLPRILEDIRQDVDGRNFTTWLAPLRQAGPVNGHLAIVAPTIEWARIVRDDYLRLISDAAFDHGIDVPIRLFDEDGRELEAAA